MTCPECSGPLWRGGPDRTHFRCLVGHAFHLNTLADGADHELDRTLWAAIRMFEQRVNISRMLGEQEHARGRPQRAQLYDSRASESQRHAQTLRELHQRRRLVLDESDE
jgi:two-component system chemotaxis response regulator CheB